MGHNDPITLGSVLLISNTIFMKMENTKLFLTVKSFEWRKFVDCFGLSIKADPSRVVKKECIFCPYRVYNNTVRGRLQ